MTIEAMKQALEALYLAVRMEPSDSIHECPEMFQGAITSLRKAIAEAEKQEPFCFFYVENGEEFFAPKGAYVPDNAQPLYTHPQPKREPLSAEQIAEIIGNDKYLTPSRIARAIEAAHGIKGEA